MQTKLGKTPNKLRPHHWDWCLGFLCYLLKNKILCLATIYRNNANKEALHMR